MAVVPLTLLPFVLAKKSEAFSLAVSGEICLAFITGEQIEIINRVEKIYFKILFMIIRLFILCEDRISYIGLELI